MYHNVFNIDEHHVFIVFQVNQRVIFLSVVVSENNRAVSWNQASEVFLVSFKKESFIKCINQL